LKAIVGLFFHILGIQVLMPHKNHTLVVAGFLLLGNLERYFFATFLELMTELRILPIDNN
jgi:hypothetical protein